MAIVDAINAMGGQGLWDETDGFYYDQLVLDGQSIPHAGPEHGGAHPALRRRGARRPRGGPAARVQQADALVPREPARAGDARLLPAAGARDARARGCWPSPRRERLVRVLGYVLDENEFLSPHGIRSLSRVHAAHPYVLDGHADWTRALRPGRLDHRHLRRKLQLARSGVVPEQLPPHRVAGAVPPLLRRRAQGRVPHRVGPVPDAGRGRRTCSPSRLLGLFLPDASGRRPAHGDEARYANDPAFRDLVLFYEFFHGDTGQGLGASHQTGWTALVLEALRDVAQYRARGRKRGGPFRGRTSSGDAGRGVQRWTSVPSLPGCSGHPAARPGLQDADDHHRGRAGADPMDETVSMEVHAPDGQERVRT